MAEARSWRPARSPNDAIVLFNGHIANAEDLARELDGPGADAPWLYAQAVARWGKAAEGRIVGEYCAVIFDPRRRSVRLSRSPLRGPPLHYFYTRDQIAAASVPRALFAAGAPRRIDQRRLADSNWMNFADEASSWYEGLARVPLGCLVEIDADGLRQERVYDVMTLPQVRLGNDREYVERATELLDEAVRAALAGSARTGVSLSGGLDSPQVAVRALRSLPAEQPLPCFTFVPERGWDGIIERGMIGDEGDAVRAFAAMHPRIEANFVANEDIAHDHRWSDMFHAMDCAPQGLCNMYMFHGIWRAAQQRGCDRLLLAEWGNVTFSPRGEWGFVEYLLTGRWRQLYRALRDHPNDPRSLPRRFAALSLAPLLPNPIWRLLMRLWHPRETDLLELLSPLSPEYSVRSGAVARARAAGLRYTRFQPTSRLDHRRKLLGQGDGDTAEIYQAFEQLYGVEQRDPTAYRPLVEFCLGLPTDLFLRDGERRWLAKQLAKGIMPEAQRANRLNGRWDADWHLRIGRRRREWLGELDRIAADPRLAAMLDLRRLKAALEDFPSATATDRQEWVPIEMAVPRGLLTARFINFVEGRNAD